MKKAWIVLFAMMVSAVMLAGCGTRKPAQTTEPAIVKVTNVDEFLAAIGPEAQIQLDEGSYVLSEAADYGSGPEGGYYAWEPQGEGYGLVIRDVQNLTILGRGPKNTILETDVGYAGVLTVKNCPGVRLEQLAIRYVGEEGSASGVELLSCENAVLEDVHVLDCAGAGVTVTGCKNVRLADSEIHSCDVLGIVAESTDGLNVENCVFQDQAGSQSGGSSIFRLEQTGNVTVSDCMVRDNRVASLIDCYPCTNVVFRNNTFRENRIQEVALDVDGGLIFDNNIVVDNLIPKWFRQERSTVLDGIGKSWNEEMLRWYYGAAENKEPDGEQTEIHVSTMDELLAAIAPDTRIVLEGEFYDLSTAADYGTGYGPYYYWSEEFDGPSLVITDVNNLTICSGREEKTACTISAVPRYANVLSFRRCSNVELSGFTAGHTVEPGYCMGGVLNFLSCDNILVENCGLYGCGTLGVQAELSSVLTVKKCDIYECSYGGIQLAEVAGVAIEECTFRDLGGNSMTFWDCKDVTVDGKAVSGNSWIS